MADISKIRLENETYNIKDEEQFFKIIRDSFKQKRKTLRNNLKEYDFTKVADVLIKHELPLDIRAENIPIDIFVEISNNL